MSTPPAGAPGHRAALEVARALMALGLHLTDGPGEASIEIRGEPLAGDDAALAVTVAVIHRGATIDSIVGRVSVRDRSGASLDVAELAQRLVSSAKLEAYASHLEQARFAVARASRRPPPVAEAPVDPAILDEQAWRPAAVRRCRQARTETTCGWMRGYLDRFPNGAHAPEARMILGLPTPNLDEPPALAAK